MQNISEFKWSNSVVGFPILFVLAIWIIFWIEVKFHIRFSEYGILPQTIEGFKGVFLSPFIHGDIKHLYNNSIPLLVLLSLLMFFYRKHAYKIVFLGIFFSGLLTWIIGRPSYHIGASSLIYVLVTYIFFRGIYSKYYRLVALSLFIVVTYGGLIWYVFPDIQPQISWEGHLSGAVVGFVFSLFFKEEIIVEKIITYDWQRPDYNPTEDVFMRHFDENGNFIELPQQTTTQDVEVFYEFKNQQE